MDRTDTPSRSFSRSLSKSFPLSHIPDRLSVTPVTPVSASGVALRTENVIRPVLEVITYLWGNVPAERTRFQFGHSDPSKSLEYPVTEHEDSEKEPYHEPQSTVQNIQSYRSHSHSLQSIYLIHSLFLQYDSMVLATSTGTLTSKDTVFPTSKTGTQK